MTYNYGTSNNGQIQSITDNVDSTRTTAFTYDAWSRLKTASNSQWSITETYDRYGNRNAQTPPVNFSQAANPVTNRLPSPYAYDASGNMTNDGSNTLVYDAEGRSISSANGAASGTYVYDGNSLRVKRCLPNCTSPTTRTVYVFSGSKVIAEYDNGAAVASPSREYIYAGAQLVATIAAGATTYHHPDHLSARVSTDSGGSTVRTFGHFPFGELWYETGTASKWKFTSYERDSESGNDYAMARSYINRLGRFSSPDLLSGSLFNPQSLNRFAYALNDVINFADPLGLDPCPPGFICVTSWGDGGGGQGGGGVSGIPIHQPVIDDPPDIGRGGGFWHRLGMRLNCAAQFGDAHSLASATGTQNSFLGKAFLGNTFSSITQLGLLVAGGPSEATASDVAIGMLSGTHQGLPGGGNIGKGPLGVATDAVAGPLAAAAYNTAVGAGTQTLELGIGASGRVATSIAGVTAETAATAVAAAKLVLDFSTFAYGGLFKCK